MDAPAASAARKAAPAAAAAAQKVNPGLLSRTFGMLRRNPGKSVLALGGVAGLIAALPKAKQEAQNLQNGMMESYMRTPGGKYVYAELEKFAERKRYMGEKVASVKVAYGEERAAPLFGDMVAGKFQEGLGTGIANAGLSAIGKLIRGTTRGVKERLFLDKQREQIIDHLVQNDPIVSVMERANPGMAIKAYASMVRFAPSLSLDPNVVTAFIREASQSSGGINPLTIQQLAQTEKAIAESRQW
jgi:hypothetical protein